MKRTKFPLEVQPVIPTKITRLNELANDLVYSWDRNLRGLFFRLDKELWETCGHNPKLFLQRIGQDKLNNACEDPVYMQEYHRVLSAYDGYLNIKDQKETSRYLDPQEDLVAYFCAEFGLHESLPIYSGGLGILAGDHCKAASDMAVPFVAIGILYRQGYFTQQIDAEGNQVAIFTHSIFNNLPISPLTGADGEQLRPAIRLQGHVIYFKVWEIKVGHIRIYLMDSDIPENSERDRAITHQLYGGDKTNRLLQEMVLGIGGVRVLTELGIKPTVWHINEGHAAFQILERCRELTNSGLDFYTALESVAASTVFTTHTPVPAGHDIFDYGLVRHYLHHYLNDLGVDPEVFLQLGNNPIDPGGFNMTALALRGSRFHNGVSRIHGTIASQMESYIWPQIPSGHNPINYVTNGVHLPTFLDNEWINQFDLRFGGGWRNQLLNEAYWEQINSIPGHTFWSVRKTLQSKMFEAIRHQLEKQQARNKSSQSLHRRLTQLLTTQSQDILTIGFARRFATYKRATLIFSDLERLTRLLNDPERPVVLIFGGKAHPHDQPGQDLIRRIHQLSLQPELEGKIILVEDFNMALARKLVSGVDIWLNNPEYPLEASGTSGQKAAMNGVLNLSIMDGWWAEGYNGENGWSITAHGPEFSSEFKNKEEANELLDLLEHEIIPLFFTRNSHGYSEGWIAKSKASMKSIIPRFNAQRMLRDYLKNYYGPAAKAGRLLTAENNTKAGELAQWKQHVLQAWPKISAELIEQPPHTITNGESITLHVLVHLADLKPEDIVIDCLIGSSQTLSDIDTFEHEVVECFTFDKLSEDGRARFTLELKPENSGLINYMIRVYPYHPLQIRRFELGRMIWL